MLKSTEQADGSRERNLLLKTRTKAELKIPLRRLILKLFSILLSMTMLSSLSAPGTRRFCA